MASVPAKYSNVGHEAMGDGAHRGNRSWRFFVVTAMVAGMLFRSTGSSFQAGAADEERRQAVAAVKGVIRDIPFDFTTQQPIAPVRVNGGRPVPFVFDTGASVNVIDEGVAREAALAGTGPRTMSGGGEATLQARFADSLTLQAADLTWHHQRAAIVPLAYPDGKHYAGLIGAPILMRYVIQFDFGARTMRLLEPAAYQPSPGAVLVPFELQEDLPVVRAIVDAGNGPVEARLMLDTGAGGAFVDLNRPFVDAHELIQAVRDAAPRRRPAGIGGSAAFVYGTGRRVVLGGITFDQPRLGLSRATAGSSSRRERDGIIGNELLKRFIVSVDYARRTVVLEENAAKSQAVVPVVAAPAQ